MANCINHKHPDIVKMAGELNISPVVLAAKIGVWQEKNNITDRFSTIDEINEYINNSHIDNSQVNNWQDIFENIFNWSKEDTTSDVVIKNILENNYIKKDSFLYDIANKIQYIPFNVSFEENFSGSVSNAYMYISEGKNIKLNLSKIVKHSLKDFVTGFLHETIHGYTLQEYYNNNNFKKEIDKEFNILKNKKELFGEYGITKPVELISELFSNPTFVDKINSIPKNNLIQKILKKILTFLGVDLNFKNEKDLKTYKLVLDLIDLKNKQYFENEQLENYLDQISDYGVNKELTQTQEVNFTLKALDNAKDESIILLNKIDFSDITDDSQPEMLSYKEKTLSTKDSLFNSNKELLFKNEDITKSFNAKDVLQNIIDSNIELSPAGTELVFKSINLLNKVNSRVKIVSQEYFDKLTENSPGEGTAVMAYNSDLNSVYMTIESLSTFNQEDILESFLHEIAHALSVKALVNPQTFEEKEFKDLIFKAFEQYKYLASVKDKNGKFSYGFTNEKEFVAELYSNAKFQEEIKNLDKGFWRKFKDAIRRLFGLPKSLVNDELIDSLLLIQKVEGFIENNEDNFNGFARTDYSNAFNGIFPKRQDTVESTKNETLESKITNLYNKAKDNTTQIIRRAKDAAKNKGKESTEYIDKLKELSEQLTSNELINKWKGVNEYVNFMNSQISYVDRKLTEGVENDLNVVERLESYLSASDLLKPIRELIKDVRIKDLPLEEQDLIKEINNKVRTISGIHEDNIETLRAKRKAILKLEFSNPRYTQEVINNFEKELSKEYPKDSNLTKKEWVSEQILGLRAQELKERIEQHVNNLLEGVDKDISGWDKAIYSTINTSSRLIQLAQKLISKVKLLIDKDVNDYDFELEKNYTEYTKDHSGSPSKMYKNIYEFDKNGKAYVKGEYSIEFRNKYISEYSKYLSEKQRLSAEMYSNNKTNQEINNDPKIKELNKKLTLWRKENLKVYIKDNQRLYKPADKYKNDISKLSKSEQNLILEYRKLVEDSNEIHRGKNSLIEKSYGYNFYTLPSVSISNLERVVEGKLNIKDTLKQKISSLTDWRPEDVEQYEQKFDALGNKINDIPVLFRNNIDPKEQSLDLHTLMRLEKYNQSNYKHKEKHELLLTSLVDIAKNKKYLKTEAGTGRKVKNLFGIDVKHVEFEGIESNTYKRLNNVVNQALYNVFKEESFKIGGKDVNKIVQTVQGHVGFLGMTLNYFNALPNVINGEFQITLEKFAGNIDKGKLRKAHLKYSSDLPNIVLDLQRPVKKSFVNQVNLMFDVFGGLTHDQQAFIKTNMLKAIGNKESLQVLQNGGEHLINSVLNMALLDSIKVKNEQGKYIDKEGNIVEESKAATILEMLKQQEDTKQLYLDDKVVYTDKSSVVKWNEGGLENIRQFIKKKIFDTMGEYDKNYQNDFQRHWYGQLVLMYKKFLVPLGVARFRGGITSITKNYKDLDPDDLHWNESLQEYEEGTYITFGRFLLGGFNQGLVEGLKNFKFSILKQKWSDLSEYEKGNMKKSLVEFGTLVMLNVIILPLLMGAADDDEDLLYLALMARRLEQDLSQYTDINDAYKITKTPIASLTLIEDTLSVGKFVLSPSAWTSTNSKDESRFLNALEKVTIPSALRPDKTSENILKYMNRDLIVPYKDSYLYQTVSE